jgi:hypothetical protein
MSQLITEVTEKDLDIIFAPMRHEFHCNILFCGFITEDAGQALEHMKTQHGTELDMMAADLEALQNGEREMIYTYSDEALRTIERDAIGKIDYPF